MTTKEELEKIIIPKFCSFDQEGNFQITLSVKWLKRLAQAILDAKFVRLEDIKIDVDGILELIYTSRIDLKLVEKEEFEKGKFQQIVKQEKVLALAKAISRAKKKIIKVKG